MTAITTLLPRDVEVIPISLRIASLRAIVIEGFRGLAIQSTHDLSFPQTLTRVSVENRETNGNKWKLNDESAAAVHSSYTIVLQTRNVLKEKKKREINIKGAAPEVSPRKTRFNHL